MLLYFFKNKLSACGCSTFSIVTEHLEKHAFAKARLRDRNQITLPKKVVQAFNVDVGDSIQLKAVNGMLEMGRSDRFLLSSDIPKPN